MNLWRTHVSFQQRIDDVYSLLYSLCLSLRGIDETKSDRKNLNIIMYMNQQRCCVQSMNVENLRGYRVSLSLYSTDSLGACIVAQFNIQPKISDDILSLME